MTIKMAKRRTCNECKAFINRTPCICELGYKLDSEIAPPGHPLSGLSIKHRPNGKCPKPMTTLDLVEALEYYRALQSQR